MQASELRCTTLTASGCAHALPTAMLRMSTPDVRISFGILYNSVVISLVTVKGLKIHYSHYFRGISEIGYLQKQFLTFTKKNRL